jgi:hypothetical protein
MIERVALTNHNADVSHEHDSGNIRMFAPRKRCNEIVISNPNILRYLNDTLVQPILSNGWKVRAPDLQGNINATHVPDGQYATIQNKLTEILLKLRNHSFTDLVPPESFT